MKRVLIFSHEFPPYLGGVGSVAHQLTEWLNDLDYNVTLVTRKQKGIKPIDGVNIIQINTLPKFWFLSYGFYFLKEGLDSFDIIILNECAPTIVAGMFFNEKQRKKCLAYVHGLEIENIYSKGNLFRKLFGYKYFHKKTIESCKRVIAVGQHMKDKFVRGSGVDDKLIDVIYVGLDNKKFNLNCDADADADADAVFNIVSTSRLIRGKGFFEKLEVFKRLTDVSCQWHVIGDGDDFDEFRSEVKRLNLSDRIKIYGNIEREKLFEIYNKMDAFWLLSNFDEALPLSYVEAQLCGLPAIGYNKGGTKEVIKNGVNGFLVDSPFESIDKIKALVSAKKNKETIFTRESIRESCGYINKDNCLEMLTKVIDE
ncbi:TPA: glycosyltransferase family 4 protein [Photobacterium damselae]